MHEIDISLMVKWNASDAAVVDSPNVFHGAISFQVAKLLLMKVALSSAFRFFASNPVRVRFIEVVVDNKINTLDLFRQDTSKVCAPMNQCPHEANRNSVFFVKAVKDRNVHSCHGVAFVKEMLLPGNTE